MEKFCSNCGIKISKYKRVLFCDKCRDERYKNKYTLICQYCGKEFKHERNRNKYCSSECSHEAFKNRVTLKCKECLKEFEVLNYRKKGVFCSNKCQGIWTQKQTEKIAKFCKHCGKYFEHKKNQKGVFCSYECNGVYSVLHLQNAISKVEQEFSNLMKDNGLDFEQQKQIGPFIADFYFESNNLIVEFNGSYWHSLPKAIKKDKRKYGYYRKHGYKLICIDENDYYENPNEQVDKVKAAFN